MILVALLLGLAVIVGVAWLKHNRPPASIAGAIKPGQDRDRDASLYSAVPSILTAAERSFYGVLEFVKPEGVAILCKVRMADVVAIRRGLSASERQRALNRVSAKHADFVLIRKTDARPLLVIELDDSSHRAEARAERDEFVDAVYQRIGLAIMHVPAQAAYDSNEVRRQLDVRLAAAGA